MKCLLIFLLPVIGAFALPGGSGENVGTQTACPAVAEFVVVVADQDQFSLVGHDSSSGKGTDAFAGAASVAGSD